MRTLELRPLATALAAGVLLAAAPAGGADDDRSTKNGFDLSRSSVPADQIRHGGPSRDGIPALDSPQAVPVAEADWDDTEIVVGVALGDQARAYPVSILNWHELVNDTLDGRPILVSYCPLCGTALVFDRKVDGRVRTFGVSGLLYQSDLLLYDRESQSLWSQISASAVSGPARGMRLRVLRSASMRWDDWKARHPQTSVLSRVTGHRRDYARNPYAGYSTSEALIFAVPRDARYHPKMPTLGIRLPEGPARAYPAVELERAGGRVDETFAGHAVSVRYNAASQVFDVKAPDELEIIEGFWFAWAAFHPETSVYQASTPEAAGERPSRSPPP